jgi:RNase P subunit RPR2
MMLEGKDQGARAEESARGIPHPVEAENSEASQPQSDRALGAQDPRRRQVLQKSDPRAGKPKTKEIVMYSDRFDILKKLANIERPCCPRCKHPLRLDRTSAGAIGFQELTFVCSTCNHFEILAIPVDPRRTDAVGWLASEFWPPK